MVSPPHVEFMMHSMHHELKMKKYDTIQLDIFNIILIYAIDFIRGQGWTYSWARLESIICQADYHHLLINHRI